MLFQFLQLSFLQRENHACVPPSWFFKRRLLTDLFRAGKMMVAAGKTMSYTGQQRLAIRVPLVRLYQVAA
jgi:hypothetical protein